MNDYLPQAAAGIAVLAWALPRVKRRLELSRAKHRSLGGHSRLAKWVARLVPRLEYAEADIFGIDGAPEAVVARRREAFRSLSVLYRDRFARSAAFTESAATSLSDLQFTGRYRVPAPFSAHVRKHLQGGGFVDSGAGVKVTDLDGNKLYDLTGSYGVNVFGTDFYRRCIAEGAARAEALGPFLGALHPLAAENALRLKAISGLDEVSFHMSGTEAVMQAVRLARYHTGRRHLVRFNGAYHGWWEDVQPGIGNPLPPRETYTLKDMDEDSLHVLATRTDIACVLVNPLQALHPNASAPGDSALVDSARRAHFDREAYAAWLHRLREVCTRRGIVLILDEVFVGFRLAPGGAQEYFGVKADLVTYGKTLGGGLPVGVVCGRADLMRRFRDDRPADICFARGTFNSHPYVMGAMRAFLDRLESPAVRALYDDLDATWNERAEQLNARFEIEDLPVRVANLSTIWTVSYVRPCAYNWMLQYYLRAEGLALSWVGTGRLIFSLDYSKADYADVADRFLAAARAMERGGWWAEVPGLTNKRIRRNLLKAFLAARFGGRSDARDAEASRGAALPDALPGESD